MLDLSMINSFVFDFWTLLGLSAQGLFFLRFVVQWYFSEKEKKTVIPRSFWYMSLLGAILTIIYSINRKDVVFLFAGVVQIAMYTRSVILSFK